MFILRLPFSYKINFNFRASGEMQPTEQFQKMELILMKNNRKRKKSQPWAKLTFNGK